MVKISIKNITNCIDYNLDSNKIETNPFITSISEKTKTDSSFNKFLNLSLKYSILIFEKVQDEIWTIKDKKNILSQIEKIIRSIYNDHTMSITQLSISSDNIKLSDTSFIDIKHILDKLNILLKKKLGDLYDLKFLLNCVNLDLPKLEPVQLRIKNKKIINNDIYIEEFSN
jgi:hypothetical protein